MSDRREFNRSSTWRSTPAGGGCRGAEALDYALTHGILLGTSTQPQESDMVDVPPAIVQHAKQQESNPTSVADRRAKEAASRAISEATKRSGRPTSGQRK